MICMEGKILRKSLRPELAVMRQMQSDIMLLKKRVNALEAEVEVIDNDVHEVRPEYLKKLEKIEKTGKFYRFKNVEEMRKDIESF
ncbi:hypothetical protein L6303_06475 [archaeon]|nr:hypothetical protein [Nanoarchaeota archaeon]MBU4300156.1 hypothetical protein [Nanoarchaeota archaeon]MCG2724362.1 hypothetical protein [archaeon]